MLTLALAQPLTYVCLYVYICIHIQYICICIFHRKKHDKLYFQSFCTCSLVFSLEKLRSEALLYLSVSNSSSACVLLPNPTVGRSTILTQHFPCCPFERAEKNWHFSCVVSGLFTVREKRWSLFDLSVMPADFWPHSCLASPESMFYLNAFCSWQLSELGILWRGERETSLPSCGAENWK